MCVDTKQLIIFFLLYVWNYTFKFMVFIESKKTHIINCITLQYLFFFCYECVCVFFARQSHTIMLYSSHIIYCHIARVIFIVILHNVHILTVLIQINILLCCTFIVRGVESTSCIFCCCRCFLRARSAGVYLSWNGRKRMLKSRTCYLTPRLPAKSSRHEQGTGRGG